MTSPPPPTPDVVLIEAIKLLAVDSGVATVAPPDGVPVLQDDSKNWSTNAHQGRAVKITGGVGIGQLRVILGNSDKVLLLDWPWTVRPGAGSAYMIVGERSLAPLATEATLAKLVPITKAAVFNTPLPAADNDLLGAVIIPTNSPSWLYTYMTIDIAGRLYLRRTVGVVTVSEDLNSGALLVANAAYCFGPIEWRAGDSINLRYSATGGNVLVLRIDEIGASL